MPIDGKYHCVDAKWHTCTLIKYNLIHDEFHQYSNHQNKIWMFSEDGINYYTGFSNRTYNLASFGAVGESDYCQTLFIGTKNNHYDEELDNVFGDGAKVNFTTAIILNKANELEIETITKSLDGSITYNILISFKVNGDNLTYTFNDSGYIYTSNSTIYNGNLDVNFTNCETTYLLY